MSSATPEGRIPRIGEVIGRYRILEMIGRGSTGPVFRAWDESLSREVALKMLWPQYLVAEDVRKRFEREARAAARLDSPFVVRVHDIGEMDGAPFIAMEYLSAGPIVTVENLSPMEWRRAVEIARDIASALALAHAQGIIHRDVKPANVMLGADGRAKLADFGLARAVAEETITLTSAGSLLGTPAYLAPEVIEGKEATPLSDIYSLGVLLFRLATGRSPFDASSAAGVLRGHLEGRFPKVAALTPGVPAALDALIAGCTAKNPEARYPGAEFVGEDLERLLKAEPIAGPPKTTEAFRIEVPFWARFIPGAERTMMTVSAEVATAEKRAKEAARLLEETEALARGLADQVASAEKNAAGWRSVAERAMEEDREDEAREALGYARQHDEQAKTWREELEKTRAAVEEMRNAATSAGTAAAEAAVKGRLLLNRRDRAKLILGESVGSRRVFATAAVIIGIAVTAGAAWYGLASWSKPGDDSSKPDESSSADIQSPINGAENNGMISDPRLPLDLGAMPVDRLPFFDDFNRPDGAVGNGWRTWWGGSVDHPSIRLSSGLIVTEGYVSRASGVFRRLPVKFPITFSFDFKTAVVRDPGNPALSGGWNISFNLPASSLPWLVGGIGQAPSRVCFFHFGGSQNMQRLYWNAAGERMTDTVPDKAEPVPGQRDYGMAHAARIVGTVMPDLSARIVVTYNDGLSPASTTFRFPPAKNPAPEMPGDFLVFGTSCAWGTHYLGNLSIRSGIE